MSFAEVLNELPALTFEQRQLLIRRAVELDGTPLSAEDEALAAERLAAHHADPASSLPLDEVKGALERPLFQVSWKVVVRPEAEQDMVEAAAWYEASVFLEIL